MEAQLNEIILELKSLKAGQDETTARLDSMQSEVAGMKSQISAHEDSNTAGIPSIGATATHRSSGTPTLPTAPTLAGPLPSGDTAGCSIQAQPVASIAQTTIQDEFQSIKDKLSSVKIPPELRVGTSRTGIRREDASAANVIANSAKYVETSIKLLWKTDSNSTYTAEDLIDIFNIQKAHIDYLRSEHSALVVAGQFGPKTSQLFKNLNRGTTNLDDRQLDTLHKAVQITSCQGGERNTAFRGGNSYFGGRGRRFPGPPYGPHGGRGRGRGAPSSGYNQWNPTADVNPSAPSE